MKKLYFNSEGWVCERGALNLPITNDSHFIEVTNEEYQKTFITYAHFAWRVINGLLINEQFQPIPEEEVLMQLRDRRQEECFSVVDRSQLWYGTLNPQQLHELQAWYQAWLEVTVTRLVPEKPAWLCTGAKANISACSEQNVYADNQNNNGHNINQQSPCPNENNNEQTGEQNDNANSCPLTNASWL